VKKRLEEALQFVTGDRWRLDFSQRTNPDESLAETFLLQGVQPQGSPMVVAYSGGLDSYAGVRSLRRGNPDLVPFLVRTQVRGSSLSKDKNEDLPESSRVPILVGFQFETSLRDKEPSGRTRTFLFFSIAAVAAQLLLTDRIVVCENGQGSLGPSLAPDAWENPFRSTHPVFSRMLGELFSKVLGRALRIEQPFLWRTKAEVLRELSSEELSAAVRQTKSCVQYPMRWKGVSPAFPCGICGGCLLRRMSLVGSGNDELESQEKYFWQKLSAPTLEAASVRVPTEERDRKVAIRSVLDMDRLARLAKDSHKSAAFRRLVFEISEADNLPESTVSENLIALLEKHAKEWKQFLDHVGRTSWIADLVMAN
jgi:7-cyano-7-deazaguanine synthase in queuosine biosynthesis